MDAALLADGVDGHDMLVVQLGSGAGFVLEALELARIHGQRKRQDFQGDAPPERDLLGLVHDAHAATADLAQDAKITQRRSRRTGRV